MSIIKNRKIIVVLGPTASGKSDLAVKIAKKLSVFGGSEIISADSRQVYRGLDIGSGKVPLFKCPKNNDDKLCGRKNCHHYKKNETLCYKNIPHHLIDVASPKRTFTVSRYQKLAKKAVQDVLKRGKIPIICGGTGLYIDALIYDYKFPEVPPQPKLRKRLEKKSTEKLFEQLQKLDPRRAKNIDRFNRRRLVRALEIILTTGEPITPLNKRKPNHYNIVRSHDIIANYKILKLNMGEVLKIGIKKSPEELKRLIKKRLLSRLRQGMVEEVENLRANGLSWKRFDDLGLEYRYVSRFLRREKQILADSTLTDEEKKKKINAIKKEMIETLKKEICRYAKRQMTWFSAEDAPASDGKRNKEIYWIENYPSPGKSEEIEKLIENFISS